MRTRNESEFRQLTASERKLLEQLLDHHSFEGRDQLRRQLEFTTARLIVEHHDNYGSIELWVNNSAPAPAAFPSRLNISTTMRSPFGCCSN